MAAFFGLFGLNGLMEFGEVGMEVRSEGRVERTPGDHGEVLNYRDGNNVGYYAAFEVNRLSPHRW
jgi:hypothetical protein